VFGSALRQSSISQMFSNERLRISARGSPVAIATRLFRRSASLPTVPMWLDPRPETRSCGASVFCTLRDMAVADVTFSCTG